MIKENTAVNVSQMDLVSERGSDPAGLSGHHESVADLKWSWNRYSRLEKLLTFLISVSTVSIVILVILLVTVKDKNVSISNKIISNSTNVCTTPSCIKAANDFLQNMDTNIDPCDDFYQYACTGFLNKIQVLQEKDFVDQFTLREEEMELQIQYMLENDHSQLDNHVVRNSIKAYKACMNTDIINSLGLKPLKDTLRKFGGWPVLEGEAWNETAFDWENLNAKFHQEGFDTSSLFQFTLYADIRNSTFRTVYLDDPSLSLDNKYLVNGLKNEKVQHYFNYMKKVAIFLGADEKIAHNELLESLNIEIMLAKMSLTSEESRNYFKLYNSMKLEELSKIAPGMIRNWTDYVHKIASNEIFPDEKVVVTSPQFFMNLTELLARQSKRNIANYMIWKVVDAIIYYLSEDIKEIQFEYDRNINGNSEDTPRWLECIHNVKDVFYLVIGNLYVTKYFNNDAKQDMLNMIENIKKELREIIEEVDWMDYQTKDEAMKKLESMKEHIAFPPELLNMSLINEFYKDLEMDETKYFENQFKISRWSHDKIWKKLREKFDKTDWKKHGDVTVINAFYSSVKNSIEFPAGILQNPFYENERPKFLNYAAIGWLIGHELTHGFDDEGSQYNANGDLFNWWANETKEHFINKSKCLVDQYGNYVVKQVNQTINGINTQGENIADNGGIKEAYRAYKKWVERNGPEKLLPGIQLNQMQLFWLSAANAWCSKSNLELLKDEVITSHHPPSEFRVNGAFRNSHDFARDFQCKSGSPMNPVHKCSLW